MDPLGIESVHRLVQHDDLGFPKRTTAIPRRCFIPSEYFFTRVLAFSSNPTSERTSITRFRGMPLLCAIHMRWSTARRSGTGMELSRRAPTVYSGKGISRIASALDGRFSGRGSGQSQKYAQRCRLPGPVRPDEAGDGPGLTVKLTSLTACF